MADEYDDGPTSQNSLGLATNPLMPMGDPMAYARVGASPDQPTPVNRMFSMQAQPYGARVLPPQEEMPGLMSNVEIPQKKPTYEGNTLQNQAPQTADAGTSNQLGGLGQLLQLQGLHDMVRPQATAAQTDVEAPAASPTSFGASKALTGTSPVSAGQYQDVVNAAAQKWGVDPKLLTSQLFHESGYNNDAVSPAGAKGIGQFMPATAKQYGIDPTNPNQSIDAAAHMMSDLQKKYGGNTQLALMGYNWGAGNVDKWLQGKGWQVPKETQDYVKRITGQDIQKPNAPSSNSSAMQAATPNQNGKFVIPAMPNRGDFTEGTVPNADWSHPYDSPLTPAENRSAGIAEIRQLSDMGYASNKIAPTEQKQQQQQVPPTQAPQKQTAQPAQGMNFNQINPQMQQLWKYMLLQSLMPRIQFRNVGYDPWAVYRLSKEGY